MKMAMKVASDALLDGLVFARDILWSGNNTAMLKLLAHRMQSRYGVDIWALRSPVEGDNATPSNASGQPRLAETKKEVRHEENR